MINLYNGDCLEVMDKLIAQCVLVDTIICDLPYLAFANPYISVILW